MNIFKQKYTLRQFGTTKFDDEGYAKTPYEDKPVNLNVQPLTIKELEVLPEGSRSQKRIKSFGDFPIHTADQEKGVIADRLFYNGNWYECESSSNWNHTLLAHYESQFVQVTESEFSEDVKALDIAEPSNDTEKADISILKTPDNTETSEAEFTVEPIEPIKKGRGKK